MFIIVAGAFFFISESSYQQISKI